MRVSLNLIKKYVDLPKELTAKQIADDLTLRTVEVESVENTSEKYNNIAVGKILEVRQHPNADLLRICITDIGEKEPVQIVCGGSNLYQGEYVVVSKPGAKVVWHGEGEPVEIKETKMRGEPSYGMICGAEEVYLDSFFPPQDEHEIVDLKGIKTYITDKNGQVKINVAKLVPKTYTAKITFDGNGIYEGSAKDVKVVVKKAKAKITAKKKTFKKSKKVKKYAIGANKLSYNRSARSFYAKFSFNFISLIEKFLYLHKYKPINVKIMKNLVEQINAQIEVFTTNASAQVEKNNKAAGTRARKAALELTKLLKEFRKVSVEEAKK